MTIEHTAVAADIKIIGAGFGRTATLSTKAALEELGFGPCYHMTEAFDHPEHASQWCAAAKGEEVHWQKLLAGYRSTIDWPACTYYKELMKIYPDAKVLLTVRDPERWYESTKSTIYRVRKISSFPIIRTLLSALFPNTHRVLQQVHETFWEKTFHGRFLDKNYAMDIFKLHIREVEQYVPREKLLVFNAKDGWQPLCAFLGVEVPKDKAFPSGHGRINYFVMALQIVGRKR